MIDNLFMFARMINRVAKLKAALVIAMTGALLWSGAAMADGYPREIAPGLTVNFPAPPRQTEDNGNKFFSSVAPSSGGNSPVIFAVISVMRFGWPQWMARRYPDLLTSDYCLDWVEYGLRRSMDPGMFSKGVQLEPVQRSASTGGFPGFYLTINEINPAQTTGGGKSTGSAIRRGQMHGYLLIVNGNLIGMGILQPEGAHFDRQVLDNLVASAHFPPADDVGTPDEQEHNLTLVAGAFLIGTLIVVIAIIALLVVGIARLVRYLRRKKRHRMAA